MKRVPAFILLFALLLGGWTHGVAPLNPPFPVTSGQNLLVRAQDIASADGSNIATWPDTSGSGNDLTQAVAGTQPHIAQTGGNDSLPFVYFDISSNWQIGNTSYSVDKQAASCFIVLDYTTLYGAKYTISLGGGTTLIYSYEAGAVRRFANGVGLSITSLTTIPSGKRVALVITMGATANKIYVDSSTNVQSLSALPAGTISGFQFGGSGPLFGKIYETRCANREWAAAEVAQILDTWSPLTYGTGSAATAPAGRLAFDGDSIVAGTGGTKARNWPYYLNPANGWLGHDYAIAGQTWANIIARQSTTNTFASSANYLLINAGANDVSTGRSSAQMQTDFQTYVASAITAGFVKSKIVAITLNTTNPGTANARSDYNTWLRANYSTYVGTLVDLAADPSLGINETTNVRNNPALWVDGVHYNDAGYVLYATLVRSAMTSSLGSIPFHSMPVSAANDSWQPRLYKYKPPSQWDALEGCNDNTSDFSKAM